MLFRSVAVNSGQFVQWQDLFVALDDGSTPLSKYELLETAMREQAKQYPQGIACLVILPPDARPPPEPVRLAVKSVLTRLMKSLTCLGYVVEGTGFKGVAARATLVGMKIFSSRPYPIYVETSLYDALVKISAHLVSGHTTSVETIMKVIAEARGRDRPPPPTRPRENEMTLK